MVASVKRTRRPVFAFYCTLNLLLSVTVIWLSLRGWHLPLMITAGPLFLLSYESLMFANLASATRAAYRSVPGFRDPINISWGEGGVAISVSGKSQHARWSDIWRWLDDENLPTIHFNPVFGQPVPRRAFNTTEAFESFRAALRQHVPRLQLADLIAAPYKVAPAPLVNWAFLGVLLLVCAGDWIAQQNSFLPSNMVTQAARISSLLTAILVAVWVLGFRDFDFSKMLGNRRLGRPNKGVRVALAALFSWVGYSMACATFGNTVPYMVTRVIGSPGQVVVETAGYRYSLKGSCTTPSIYGVPEKMMGGKALCAVDAADVPESGATLEIRGRSSAFGIIEEQWRVTVRDAARL